MKQMPDMINMGFVLLQGTQNKENDKINRYTPTAGFEPTTSDRKTDVLPLSSKPHDKHHTQHMTKCCSVLQL